MSRSIGALTIDLILKTVGLTQGADKAQRELEKRAKEIEKTAKRVGAAVGTALVAGGALVANQLKNTINQMDELSKAAQRASLPTEEFSKLAYAGELADVSIQDLQASLGRLAKAQADAEKSTSTQGRIFDALGISTKNAEGNLRSTYEVFLDFADAFQEYQGSPEIVAAGLNIFGRSFQNLIPLLKDGSEGLKAAGIEAEQLGLVLSTEAGQQAEQFNDDLTRLKSSLTGLWREVAAQVLPQLVQLSGEFVAAAKDGDTMKKAADGIAEALRAVADTASFFAGLISALGTVRQTLADIEKVVGSIHPGRWMGDKLRDVLPAWLYQTPGATDPSKPSFSGVVSGSRTLSEDTFGLNAPNALALKLQEERRRKLAGVLGAFGDTDKGSDKAAKEAERQAERIRKAILKMRDAQREWQTELEGTGNPILDSYAQRLDEIRDKAEQYKELKVPQAQISEFTSEMERLALSIKDKELAEFSREFDWETRQLQNSIEGTSNAAVDYERALYDLDKQLKQNLISQTQYDERLEGIKADRFAGATQIVSDLQFELELMKMTNAERATAIQLRGLEAEAVAEYGEAIANMNKQIEQEIENSRFMDNIRSEFSNFITDVVDGTTSIKDAFKSMLDNINQMIAQRIADQWVEQLFGSMGSTNTGSSGGWLATLAGMFAGGRASGGWIGGGKLAEVNERGLEMATVRGRDYLLAGNSPVEITPNSRMGMGGQVSITQQFINPVMADRRSDSQRAAEAARRQREAMRNA